MDIGVLWGCLFGAIQGHGEKTTVTGAQSCQHGSDLKKLWRVESENGIVTNIKEGKVQQHIG